MLISSLLFAAIVVVLLVVIKACLAEPSFEEKYSDTSFVQGNLEALDLRIDWESSGIWDPRHFLIDLDFLALNLESGQYTKKQLMALRDRIDKYLAK
jgi:hypothetical protein